MHIAIEGCAHGELDTIYRSLEHIQEIHKIKIDLLICCGDFQSVRNNADLQSMACSAKYRTMNSFYKYYSGEKEAPITTIFIGGNHEAASHLYELPFGGWVAPKIFYLGNCGSVMFGGLRISGLSGIYKDYDYFKPRFERPPFTEQTMRSAYHQRNVDVLRLSKLQGDVDILLSHDWPVGVTKHGNEEQLLRFKNFFAEDIQANKLGSPAVEHLMKLLQPKYHFAAHLHCRFPAIVNHPSGKVTKFLALDKVLPNRHFLQILEFPSEIPQEQLQLQYDMKWLAILKITHLLEHPKNAMNLPEGIENIFPSEDDIRSIEENYKKIHQRFDFVIPDNFRPTQPAYDPRNPNVPPQPPYFPQTDELMELLGEENIFHNPPEFLPENEPMAQKVNETPTTVDNPEEIELDDEE